jgi:hypothetical protein
VLDSTSNGGISNSMVIHKNPLDDQGDLNKADAGAGITVTPSPQLSLQQLLHAAMKQSMVQPSPTPDVYRKEASAADKSVQLAIKSELSLFESTGRRGQFLDKVYSYLLSIPPTSVEAERAFSAAGGLCTKIRSRLGDDVLDTLCFLRSIYTAERACTRRTQ